LVVTEQQVPIFSVASKRTTSSCILSWCNRNTFSRILSRL